MCLGTGVRRLAGRVQGGWGRSGWLHPAGGSTQPREQQCHPPNKYMVYTPKPNTFTPNYFNKRIDIHIYTHVYIHVPIYIYRYTYMYLYIHIYSHSDIVHCRLSAGGGVSSHLKWQKNNGHHCPGMGAATEWMGPHSSHTMLDEEEKPLGIGCKFSSEHVSWMSISNMVNEESCHDLPCFSLFLSSCGHLKGKCYFLPFFINRVWKEIFWLDLMYHYLMKEEDETRLKLHREPK